MLSGAGPSLAVYVAKGNTMAFANGAVEVAIPLRWDTVHSQRGECGAAASWWWQKVNVHGAAGSQLTQS